MSALIKQSAAADDRLVATMNSALLDGLSLEKHAVDGERLLAKVIRQLVIAEVARREQLTPAGMRQARNWSQVQLAERAGVSDRTIKKIESGRGAHDSTLRKLATIMGPGYIAAVERMRKT